MRWWKAPWAWVTVKETASFAYQSNSVTGKRRLIRLRAGGFGPDYGWLATGVWSPPPTPPKNYSPSVRPFVVGSAVAASLWRFGGPIDASDLAWLRATLAWNAPSGHCGESSAEMIERQRREERVARIVSALEFHVPDAKSLSTPSCPTARGVLDVGGALEPDDVVWLRAVINQIAGNSRCGQPDETDAEAIARKQLLARMGRLKVAFGFIPPVVGA